MFAHSSGGIAAIHCCHAPSTPAAEPAGKCSENTVRFGAGSVSKVNSVTMPKLPPPPPRSAQNRSGSELADAVTQLAVGGDDLRGAQVVAGQAVLAGQHADAAAEGQPGDADGRAGAGGQRAPGRRQRGVDVHQLRAGADHGLRARDVHLRSSRPRSMTSPLSGWSSRRSCDRRCARRAEAHGGDLDAGLHVLGACRPRDGGRVAAVEQRVVRELGGGVAVVARQQQFAGELVAQRVPVRRHGRHSNIKKLISKKKYNNII